MLLVLSVLSKTLVLLGSRGQQQLLITVALNESNSFLPWYQIGFQESWNCIGIGIDN